RKATGAHSLSAVPQVVNDVLHSSGEPLPASTRASMESRFGHSFGDVSVAPSVELTRPDDPSERQADAIAGDVLSGRASSPNTFDFSHVRLHRGARAAA